MFLLQDIIFYVLAFLSVYIQVFFFVTFLENRKRIVVREGHPELSSYPAVTIAVPCWNEEHTLPATIQSLRDLNYPKNKLTIFLIDDGSTDGTWNIIQKFAQYPNVKIFRKENGGKHTALNLALENTETDFFGGLDADSTIHPESLARIMSYFEKDKSAMAVAPSVIVYNPKKFIQNAQKTEYDMGVYLKKMLGFLGAIPVTPGPLTIFRKKVFDDLGHYRHGHNTEDMEIAYRMHKNHYKIEYCNDAFVYTNSPSDVKKLYRQRLRWIYGFINNTIDYRQVLFDKKYGNFSFFTLPVGVISILAVSYLFVRIILFFGYFVYSKIVVLSALGWNFDFRVPSFDFFFIHAPAFSFLIALIYSLVIFSMIFGRKMTNEKRIFSLDILYFFPVFILIAPFWFFQAIYSTIIRRRPAWR
ncbi:glycosyltransferase family 2 protein [Candidatus Nomurabacteria bacterium]|nr:glycosyltransferase family 2 protein [Candidatus Nomurabacteria bacterium]